MTTIELAANANANMIECPVCFENIGDKNSCVTTCGHKFCLNCLLQSYNSLNNCPLCRETLNANEKPEDEDDDDYDDDYDDEDDDDSITLEDSENEEDMSETGTEQTTDIAKLATVENITNELKKHGYTMEDIVSMYLDRPLIKDTVQHTVNGKIMYFELEIQNQVRKKMVDTIIDDLDDIAKREYDENELMGMEDHRSMDAERMELLANLPFSMSTFDDDEDVVW
jgi:hypothetical protein